ncbi:MAG: PspC domain-containing protein [Coriobacteriia bacterium]
MGTRNRNDWMAIAAIALIAFGVWMLAGRILGPWMDPVREAIRFATRLIWPLAVIGLGVLLLMASRSGGLRFDAHGKRLYRSRSDRMVSGVLGGLAVYLDFDPTILRVGYVLVTIAFGGWTGVIGYIIASMVIPEEPVGVPAADVHLAPQPMVTSEPAPSTASAAPPAPPSAPVPSSQPAPPPAPAAPPTDIAEPAVPAEPMNPPDQA